MKILILTITLLCTLSVQASIDTQQSILNMKVTGDGIYRVHYSDILNLGVDLLGVDIKNLSVINNGQDVPVKVISDNQSTFGVNSYIEFVGQSQDSLYQKGTVYSVILKESIAIKDSSLIPQLNQQTENFYLHTDLYAQNSEYNFGSPISDPWFYKRILAIGNQANEILNFEMNNLVQQENVQIEMNIWGGTDYPQSPDHHVIFELNGQAIDDFRFDGLNSEIRQYQIASNTLVSGNQQINVVVPNDTNTAADVIHIESWKVTYPRTFVLNNKSLNFNNNGNAQNSNLDVIFKHGFESDDSQVSTIKHFNLNNANNEGYSIYHVSQNGSVKTYQSLSSASCGAVVTAACSVIFSIENVTGTVYVAAESEIMIPELSLPVILTDINQGNADYLIITHPDFIGAELDAFVALKQQNFVVKVVDVEQIYAQYGFANISSNSIAAYIKYAGKNLGVNNVLLVGGDTYDYKNYLNLGSVSFIPTIYARTDEFISYAPVDAKYVDIDGDNIPDINIGRFPVRTEQELANLRLKIEAYTTKTYSKTSVFAADKFDLSNGYSFTDDAAFLISQLPQQWQNNITANNKAYIDDDGVALAKSKISDNINQGVALTSFIGHSGPRDWSFSRMFSASDANLLTNSTAPTLVTQWGCWNTYFVSPTEDTLAHAFMLNQNGGAASVLGASTLTKAEHEKGLAQLVLTLLTHNELSLGDAVTQAKRTYAQTNPDALDVILGWNILGDPSLKL